MNLENRTALVTGASRGIGRAIALRLAREGAVVAVNYHRRATEAENVVALIHQQSGRALAVQADVGDAAQVRAMIKRITCELGPLDILVNNAGVFAKGGSTRKRRKPSNKAIVRRRKSRRYGQLKIK